MASAWSLRIRARKRAVEFLALLKALRARWPGEKLYVVCDDFSPHRHARVHAWCADNDVELVFTPTYGSWSNWIEAGFAALRYFASTAPATAATPSRTPPSLATSAGTTFGLSRRSTSPPTHRSEPGPITRQRLRDEPLVPSEWRVTLWGGRTWLSARRSRLGVGQFDPRARLCGR